jgi:hypothetical protein
MMKYPSTHVVENWWQVVAPAELELMEQVLFDNIRQEGKRS